MENTFVIAWRSKKEPRSGQGNKHLTREEAEALAEELNHDYPAFVHEAVNLEPSPAASTAPAGSECSVITVDFQPTAPPLEEVDDREAVLI
jgi:hypothetical protein